MAMMMDVAEITIKNQSDGRELCRNKKNQSFLFHFFSAHKVSNLLRLATNMSLCVYLLVNKIQDF